MGEGLCRDQESYKSWLRVPVAARPYRTRRMVLVESGNDTLPDSHII